MKDTNKTKAKLIAELTELRQHVAELEKLVTEQGRALSPLEQEGQIFNSALEIGQVMTIIMAGVRALLDVSVCSLWLIDPETNDLICRQATGHRYELVRGWRLSPGQGIANWVVRHDQSLIVADTRLDPHHYKEIDDLIGLELRSILSVPLRIEGQVIGCLQVTDTTPDRFNATELNLIEAVASTAAVAIENTRQYTRAKDVINQRLGAVRATKLVEQLQHSQKMEAIGRLAGGIAHDLNNILAVIMGHAGLAIELLPTDHKTRPDIEGIQTAADRAAELTRNLLTFARHRHQIIDPQVLNLNDFIDRLEPSFHRLLGSQIKLMRRMEPHLASIEFDPDQLEEVLVNLIVNAREAMPEGGQLILETANIKLAPPAVEAKPGAYVLLAVRDSGQGMSAEVQKHLFEPFFTTKEVGQGKGVALAICYGLVKQSGGHIEVESDPGQGSTFKLYLPRVQSEPVQIEPKPLNKAQPSGHETILLVEDEASLRYLAARTLRNCGYQVLEAKNGHEALQLLEESEATVELLVTDVIMPEMNGKVLADKAKIRQPDLKVLFVSGFSGQALRDKGLVDPIESAFLLKPFKQVELAGKVRQVLEG